MIKLVDLRSETTFDVTFGTCELCMHTGTLNEEWFVFEDDKGNTCEIATGGWDWGDYYCYYEVENLADFCQFILDKKIPDFKTLEEQFSDLYYEYTEKLYTGRDTEEEHECFEVEL